MSPMFPYMCIVYVRRKDEAQLLVLALNYLTNQNGELLVNQSKLNDVHTK